MLRQIANKEKFKAKAAEGKVIVIDDNSDVDSDVIERYSFDFHFSTFRILLHQINLQNKTKSTLFFTYSTLYIQETQYFTEQNMSCLVMNPALLWPNMYNGKQENSFG